MRDRVNIAVWQGQMLAFEAWQRESPEAISQWLSSADPWWEFVREKREGENDTEGTV